MHEKSRYSFTHCFKQIFVHVFTQVLLPTPNRQDFDTKAPHPDHYADVTNKRWRLLQSILAFIFMYNECKWRCGIHLYIVYGSDTDHYSQSWSQGHHLFPSYLTPYPFPAAVFTVRYQSTFPFLTVNKA